MRIICIPRNLGHCCAKHRAQRLAATAALSCLVLQFGLSMTTARADDGPLGSFVALRAEELSEGWIALFDGQSLFGWTSASDANWRVDNGTIRVDGGEPGLLFTDSQFADYELSLEFRAAVGSNSGVFLHTPPRPTAPAVDCYELNIAPPENPFPTASFVGRQKSSAADVDDGQWHAFDVVLRGGQISVRLDGKLVLEYRDPQPLSRGHIGLQLNQGTVEFRSIRLKPLGYQRLLQAGSLGGWRVYPDKAAEFKVSDDAELWVRGGNGQLETEGEWADFILRTEVFVNGEGLNSGIFFRSIPGEFWQGYESQIQNAFRSARDEPVDCGTGGFYRRQDARWVAADDFTWFHKTLVVCDDQMATWVNGLQVSNWTDTRAANTNPRRGLRREAGTIVLQAHDPTTNLRFRNMAVAEISDRR